MLRTNYGLAPRTSDSEDENQRLCGGAGSTPMLFS